MIIIAAICFVFGAALGLRHKVFVLIPAGIVAFSAVAGVAFAIHFSIWRILLMELISLTALQMGYLIAAGVALAIMKPREQKDTTGIAVKAQRLSR